jgi:hypothetical protein
VVSFDSIAKSERINIQLLEKIGYNALFVKDKSYIPSGYMTTDDALKFERSLWKPDIIEKVLFFDFFYHRRSMPIINSLRGIDSTLVNDGMYKETLLDYNNMAAAIGPVHPVFEFELRTETYMSLFGTRLFSDEYRKLAFFDRYPMLMYNISNSVMAMKPEHIIAYVNLIDVK